MIIPDRGVLKAFRFRGADDIAEEVYRRCSECLSIVPLRDMSQKDTRTMLVDNRAKGLREGVLLDVDHICLACARG
ncbi:hypothetical protein SEA_ELINAL_47 [Gordonia phage Elinal]|nr:hypothetical protein SEA_ELINAL_47 [Gordonia phage Elinal]